MKCTSNYGLLLFFLVFHLVSSSAQEYHHGFGLQFDYGQIDQEFTNIAGQLITVDENPSMPGVMYKATLGFTDNFALSSYPFLGFFANANSSGGSSGGIGFQLPILAELYFGDLARKCFIIGGGLSYSFINSSTSGTGSIFGPQISLGGQFELQDRVLGIRLAYTRGLTGLVEIADMNFSKDSRSLFTIGLYNMIGQ